MKSNKILKLLLLVVTFAIVATMITVFFAFKDKGESTLKIGFIMSGSTTEQGWNSHHYKGIVKACDELDAELIVKEEIKENSGQCEVAIRELADEGVEIIILSSYGYAEEILDVVKEYKDIMFYSESFGYSESNLNCYFARAYQARYLTGIIAGMISESDCIGYVAAMPNSEVNRGINAFTLGVKRVNPSATVVVAWSDSWDDKDEETRLAQELINNQNIDVITYHQNQPNVVDVAESNGVYSIGYHEVPDGVSDKFITAVEFNWDVIYKELVLDYKRGKSDVVNTYWFGLDQGAVELSEVSKSIPQDVIQELETAEQEIIDGKHVFSGIIYDTDGKLRCDTDENIGDEMLMKNMDWYVEGVEFYEK